MSQKEKVKDDLKDLEIVIPGGVKMSPEDDLDFLELPNLEKEE